MAFAEVLGDAVYQLVHVAEVKWHGICSEFAGGIKNAAGCNDYVSGTSCRL